MIARLLSHATMMGFLLVSTSYGQSSQSQKQGDIRHIAWGPILETKYDITRENFRDMGLSALSPQQAVNLFEWADSREKKTTASHAFVCGRPGESFENARKPGAYDKVRVYVTATGDASEIISGVRERLRGMNGIEVVYSRDEADVGVGLVAIHTATIAGYPTGVAISAVVQIPCVQTIGTMKVQRDDVEDQLVQVGSDVPAVVASIVSVIDTRDFEGHRQSNAFTRKALQGSE